MKLKKAKVFESVKPFVSLQKPLLSIQVNTSANRIVGFNVAFEGKEKEFPVKDMNVESAWKELETFINKCKR